MELRDLIKDNDKRELEHMLEVQKKENLDFLIVGKVQLNGSDFEKGIMINLLDIDDVTKKIKHVI